MHVAMQSYLGVEGGGEGEKEGERAEAMCTANHFRLKISGK